MPSSSACRHGTSLPGNRFRSRPAMCSPWTASPVGSSSTASCAPRRCASPATTRCVAASSISTRRAWPSRCGSISFGDTLETIRSFDPESQRTTDQLRALDLVPVAEFQLTTETIRRFRLGYVEAFGAPAPDDLLYHAVSEGRRHPGMEHWLPLFHDRLDTLLDYVPGSSVVLEPLAEDAARERLGSDQGLFRRAAARAYAARIGAALQATAARTALSRRSRMARAARKRGHWRCSRRSQSRKGRGR